MNICKVCLIVISNRITTNCVIMVVQANSLSVFQNKTFLNLKNRIFKKKLNRSVIILPILNQCILKHSFYYQIHKL
jgi:hypothetical protein